MEVNHKWLSARAYSQQTGLGEQIVKQFIRAGKLEGEQTEDGYWKVKVYKDDAVSRKEYEEVKRERDEAETTLNLLKKILVKENT